MFKRRSLARALSVAIALCVVGLSSMSAEAARIDRVTKDSHFAEHFKVTAKKEAAGIRVYVTVPKSMHEYRLGTVSYYVDSQTRMRTNGTSIEFLIEEESFEKAYVNAGYSDPNHNPEETGGYWAFQLNISSLADGVK